MVSVVVARFLLLEGLESIYVRVTHRMDGAIYRSITEEASASSKRGCKKRKKKGKPGKVSFIPNKVHHYCL